MNEFKILEGALKRVGANFTVYDLSNIGSKSITFETHDGELELEFDGEGTLVDVTLWS